MSKNPAIFPRILPFGAPVELGGQQMRTLLSRKNGSSGVAPQRKAYMDVACTFRIRVLMKTAHDCFEKIGGKDWDPRKR